MSKEHRCSRDEVYVVGFVPSYLLPKKRPISLDPFLDPLMMDIEDGFIDGNLQRYILKRIFVGNCYSRVLEGIIVFSSKLSDLSGLTHW